jgi:hypothetical protein
MHSSWPQSSPELIPQFGTRPLEERKSLEVIAPVDFSIYTGEVEQGRGANAGSCPSSTRVIKDPALGV